MQASALCPALGWGCTEGHRGAQVLVLTEKRGQFHEPVLSAILASSSGGL